MSLVDTTDAAMEQILRIFQTVCGDLLFPPPVLISAGFVHVQNQKVGIKYEVEDLLPLPVTINHHHKPTAFSPSTPTFCS